MTDIKVALRQADSDGERDVTWSSGFSDDVGLVTAFLMADKTFGGWAGDGRSNGQSQGGEAQEMHDCGSLKRNGQ